MDDGNRARKLRSVKLPRKAGLGASPPRVPEQLGNTKQEGLSLLGTKAGATGLQLETVAGTGWDRAQQ